MACEGFSFANNHDSVKIRVVVTDAPPRSFITYTKPFCGCEKCLVKFAVKGSRTVFLEIDSEPRTDEKFGDITPIEHHIHKTPFEESSM